MQTFITDFDMIKNARNLDNKRLGKQRVEAIQIVTDLLIKPSRWHNHPAVQMWKGFENYLVTIYITCMLAEWERRGFSNLKSNFNWESLLKHVVGNISYIEPYWITTKFIESHRSNLIRKFPEHYKPLFPNTKKGLEYIWPTKL